MAATENTQNALVDPFALDGDGYFWLKGNLHSHTTNSDGRVSPQERLDGYVNQDYDFLCLSDHNDITRVDSVEAPDDFVLIQGAELHPSNPFGGQIHHFVCLNIHEDMDARRMPPQMVIDEVREQGGSVWLAHPHWSSVNILRDTVPLNGLAGIEVFNTTCCRAGRGDSSVHWDDWMSLEDRLYPALSNDDSHADESEGRDTYEGWTMARVKERTAEAVLEALNSGCTYSTTGPEIRDISLRRLPAGDGEDSRKVEATVRCSEAQAVRAVNDAYGTEYRERGSTFEEATFPLRPGSRWVRFEVIGPDGRKAWSNPRDLSEV